tara:strand:+ start:191 stop:1177 length:987 start_codon:yes stop_codon:yes gene_type:complete
VSVSYRGRRIRRDFPSLDEATVFEAEANAALLAGREIKDPNWTKSSGVPCTFGGMADHIWKMEWCNQKARDHTFNRMLAVVEHFGDRTPLEDITSYDLEQYVLSLRSIGNSPATINRKLAITTKVFNYAHRHGLIKTKPTVSKQREPEGRVEYYSAEGESKMLSVLTRFPNIQDLFEVLIDTGMRRGEALTLEWRDVDFDKNQITLSDPDKIKTALPRSIPMTSRVCSILTRRYKQIQGDFQELEFPQRPFPYTDSYVDGVTRSCRKDGSECEAVFHTCRHTFISRLIQKGVPLVTVKTLAGHRSIQTTMRYAHLAPSNFTDAISVLE